MDGLRLIRLDAETQILPFDCNNEQLNGFLFDDAKNHLRELVATTFLLINQTDTVGYWCYQNDKITVGDINGNFEKFIERIASCFGREIKEKEYKSFPAVKIGRLGVSDKYKGNGIGSNIIAFTKELFVSNNRTGCRFITVDAFKESVSFYERNGFKYMSSKDKRSDTRQMYYDLLSSSR